MPLANHCGLCLNPQHLGPLPAVSAEDKGVETVGQHSAIGIMPAPKEHGQMNAQEVGQRRESLETQ